MRAIQIKQELHQIIDEIEDNKFLEAVYTLLSNSGYSKTSKALTKKEMDIMLEDSEIAIKEGRVINHKELKSELTSWRRK